MPFLQKPPNLTSDVTVVAQAPGDPGPGASRDEVDADLEDDERRRRFLAERSARNKKRKRKDPLKEVEVAAAEVSAEERAKRDAEKEERRLHAEQIKLNTKRRKEDRRRLTQKTKRGQPNLNSQMGVILAKLQQGGA